MGLLALSGSCQNQIIQGKVAKVQQNSADPDVYKTFQQIVEDNGFIFEEHLVYTPDNYTLKVFRIPAQKINEHEVNSGKPVVFMQHGLLDSADCWIMNHAEVSPAFVASRAGYDVWLGNNRGNKYSHHLYSGEKSKQQYWDFSFQEMGDFDIPAMIQYVLNVTNQEKLAYAGHSQGTTQMFYALATNEEFLASRVSVVLAFGPVAQLNNSTSKMVQLFASNLTRKVVVNTCNALGMYEWFSSNWVTTGSMRLICDTFPKVCEYGVYLNSDNNLTDCDEKRIQVYLGHYPSGSSLKSFDHLGQMLDDGKMQKFDYGKKQNLQIYGNELPPLIDLTKISKVPIGLFVGQYDELADKTDAQWLKTQLKTLTHYKEYELGHLAFFVAKDMSYFTQDAMNLLMKYQPLKQNAFKTFLQ
eukprot:403366326